MARAIYRINEFIGIDQSRDENALKSAMSPGRLQYGHGGRKFERVPRLRKAY